MKLFEFARQYIELEKLTESDDIPHEVIADTLEAIEGEFDDKAVAVAKMVLTLEAEGAAIKAAADAMMDRASRVEHRADSLRAYLLFQLQTVDRKRIETSEVVIARRANPVAVQVTNEDEIPPRFYVQPEPPPPRLDKKALKVALQAGEAISGAYLESGERVEIKC
jgi:hypothetical protein